MPDKGRADCNQPFPSYELRELHNEGKDKRDNGNMFQLDFDEDEFDIKSSEETKNYKRLIYTRKDYLK